MVTANVDIPALKARHPLGDTVEAFGRPSQGKGQGPPGRLPLPRRGGGQLHGVRRLGAVLLLRLRSRRGRAGLRAAHGGPEPAGGDRGGWTAAQGLRPGPPFVQPERGVLRPPRCLPRDPALLTAAARFYAGRLRRSSEAREYLASRGVGPVAAARLGLGYSPGSGLRQALESLGFSADRIRDSGLFMERGAERFAGMVVVPDASGGLVRWLVGRALDPDVKPRFQAPPGPKPVLGLGRLGPCLAAGRSWPKGVFDWLALTGWGIPACAALGTQGVERIASALRGCPRVFLAFDSDDAGLEATERLLTLIGRRAAAVTLPQGVGDVGELAALPHGRAVFLRLLSLAARSSR